MYLVYYMTSDTRLIFLRSLGYINRRRWLERPQVTNSTPLTPAHSTNDNEARYRRLLRFYLRCFDRSSGQLPRCCQGRFQQCSRMLAARQHFFCADRVIQIPQDLRINFNPDILLDVTFPQGHGRDITVHAGQQVPRAGL